MNCGPGEGDPRTGAERKFLCDDCIPVEPKKKPEFTATPWNPTMCCRCGLTRAEVRREGARVCCAWGVSYPRHYWLTKKEIRDAESTNE